MCGYCGCTTAPATVAEHHHHHHHDHEVRGLIQIEQDILAENQRFADLNRAFLQKNNIKAFNFVSSPGSGKTTLLIETIKMLQEKFCINVIEGDQQTDLDQKRIATTGVKALQVNTGKSCHLDAHRIAHALEELSIPYHSLLFIENVGNLVCPALFDLGETAKIVILSVTEGDDKPLKYPYMFDQSQLLIINKMDLLPYVTFDVARCIQYAKQINPAIEVLTTSATTLVGMELWQAWLLEHV